MGSYPLPIWSGSIRTNNHVEGWHNHPEKIVGKTHPIMYSRLLKHLKKEQALTEVTMAQLAAEAAPPIVPRSFREDKIDEVKQS